MQDLYNALVTRVARVICARTNLAAKDSPLPIFDVPDDLVWIDTANGPVLSARWQLYEDRARAALAEVGLEKKLIALAVVLHEVRRAKAEESLPDFALIEKLVTAAME